MLRLREIWISEWMDVERARAARKQECGTFPLLAPFLSTKNRGKKRDSPRTTNRQGKHPYWKHPYLGQLSKRMLFNFTAKPLPTDDLLYNTLSYKKPIFCSSLFQFLNFPKFSFVG